jgi:CTP:phosphocholine cytidylyltransferase-like protein
MKPYKAENAIILAAGLSSRLAPLSYEYPKSLLKVRGEVLIERQIRQLKEAGINNITVVVGYKKELFNYLKEKFNVEIVENPEYKTRNNNSSLYYVKEKLGNTYICSSDNYFAKNVFELYVEKPFYSAVYIEGKTDEWCITTDSKGLITDVKIGGEDSWVMLGHVFFTKEFSSKFVEILESIYHKPETAPLLWESIYLEHIDQLELYIRKYPNNIIYEFDTLDELRAFDKSYWNETGSKILKHISLELNCKESDITNTIPIKKNGEVVGFQFLVNGQMYCYDYETGMLKARMR